MAALRGGESSAETDIRVGGQKKRGCRGSSKDFSGAAGGLEEESNADGREERRWWRQVDARADLGSWRREG